MYKLSIGALVAGMGLFLLAGVSFAQEPELPLAWEGKGAATFIGNEGEQKIDFDLKFKIDSEGVVSGQTSTGDGQAQIERFYYGEEVKSQSPALPSRKAVLVLSIRGGDTPLLAILDGRALGDKHFYGELRLARMNAEGIKEALDIGNKTATEVSAEALPSGLKKALKESVPMGYFGVKGKRLAEE